MLIRIGVVDDHSIMWDGVCNLIEDRGKYNVVFQAHSGIQCLELLESNRNTIDILLLDLSMSELGGLDVVRIIKSKYFHIKIIFLTSFDDYGMFSKALNMGIDGYLLKNVYFSELETAIEKVYVGLCYVDSRLHRFYKKYKSKTYIVEQRLTTREREVINCVAAGMLNKEIAYFLCIREETVKNHLSNVFRKFQVNDRTQAVIYAVKNNYIDL